MFPVLAAEAGVQELQKLLLQLRAAAVLPRSNCCTWSPWKHAGFRTLPRPPVLLGRRLPQPQPAAKLQAAKSSLLAKLLATTHSLKPVAKTRLAAATAATCCNCQVQPPVAVAAGVAVAVAVLAAFAVLAAVAAAAVALGPS